MDNSERIAAIEAGFLSDYLALYFDKRDELAAGRDAFRELLAHLQAVEAENERLRVLMAVIVNGDSIDRAEGELTARKWTLWSRV